MPQPAPSFSISHVDHYLADIQKYPMLTREEEYELAVRVHDHKDLEAAAHLTQAHLRYAANIARQYAFLGPPLLDLIQEANIGLMKAVHRFDPYTGNRLVTVARDWVKSEILDYVRSNHRMIKVATDHARIKVFYNLKKLLGNDTLTKTRAKDIAAKLNVNTSDVYAIHHHLTLQDESFPTNEPDFEDGQLSFVNFMTSGVTLEDVVFLEREGQRRKTCLNDALKNLNERERTIIRARRLEDKPKTLSELADSEGVSMERIRQIENAALKKMKQSAHEEAMVA